MATPRVFIIRHGETEWSRIGKYTSTTDLPLTAHGESRVKTTGRALIGEDRLIAPSQIAHIYVSPMQRAQQTLQLLHSHLPPSCVTTATTTDLLKEWDYGEYEGELRSDIRKKAGGVWNIWTEGCPGGESPKEVEERCDRIIQVIREKWHKPAFEGKRPSGDVIVVAHGHLLRALATRWIGRSIGEGVPLVLEAGGVGTLSYDHANIDEPAILLGGAFVVEEEKEEKRELEVRRDVGAEEKELIAEREAEERREEEERREAEEKREGEERREAEKREVAEEKQEAAEEQKEKENREAEKKEEMLPVV